MLRHSRSGIPKGGSMSCVLSLSPDKNTQTHNFGRILSEIGQRRKHVTTCQPVTAVLWCF